MNTNIILAWIVGVGSAMIVLFLSTGKLRRMADDEYPVDSIPRILRRMERGTLRTISQILDFLIVISILILGVAILRNFS